MWNPMDENSADFVKTYPPKCQSFCLISVKDLLCWLGILAKGKEEIKILILQIRGLEENEKKVLRHFMPILTKISIVISFSGLTTIFPLLSGWFSGPNIFSRGILEMEYIPIAASYQSFDTWQLRLWNMAADMYQNLKAFFFWQSFFSQSEVKSSW